MSLFHTRHQPLRSERHIPPLEGATGWLNSGPLDPVELRGHVVLVNFWTLTCINWLRQEPYVRAWSQAYRDDGLIVVGVHTPEFTFEHDIGGVRRATQERAIDYAVALDNDYEVWSTFAKPLLAGALLRPPGLGHPRPALRRGALRAVGARDPAPARHRARARARRRARRGGGGRLEALAHARDLSRLQARRAVRLAECYAFDDSRAYEVPEPLRSNHCGLGGVDDRA